MDEAGKTLIERLNEDAVSCGLPSAIEAIGERWAFLILRAAFNGLRHFDEMQPDLGIARNILSDRLARLTARGIFERRPCADDRRRVEYRLTEKGEALLPAIIALRQWGENWETGVPSNPVLVDRDRGRPVRAIAIHAEDGRPLGWHDLRWRDRAEIDGGA